MSNVPTVRRSETNVGLTLHLNVFRDVHHDAVLHSLRECHRARGFDLLDDNDRNYCYQLHEMDSGWVVLELPIGWSWDVWRTAHSFVSRELSCYGFLVFVYDGDYWGYELFKDGESIDQFVQVDDRCDGNDWFPGLNINGNPHLLANAFPFLSPDLLADYFVRDPVWATSDHIAGADYDAEFERRRAAKSELDVRVQPDDEFSRFDECAVLNFLRYLGVSVSLQDHYVTFTSPIMRSFRLRHRAHGRRT